MSKSADRLRLDLLQGQRRLREQSSALIVVIGGVEGAGRHAVINTLTHLLDTRGLRVHAWTLDDAPGPDRPRFWRYWQALPSRGDGALFLNGWYAEPLTQALRGATPDLARETDFETLLRDDGALVLKFWLGVPLPQARRRIRQRLQQAQRPPLPSELAVLAAPDDAEACIDALTGIQGDWHFLDGCQPKDAATAALKVLRHAMEEHLAMDEHGAMDEHLADDGPKTRRARRHQSSTEARLAALPPPASTDKPALIAQLAELQTEFSKLLWAAQAAGRAGILVLEGWDAAGKGGVIRRVTGAVDARLFQVHPIAAPSDEERAHPWLWRFWRRLPRRGRMAIFDRSWYGRVLVERVEKLASRSQWQRAYDEIADFESQLTEEGVVLVKVWLHIQPQTQLERFQARAKTPHKHHKLTDEDWRNRERWDDYLAAAEDMFQHTDRPQAPWTLVAADDKRWARVQVLDALVQAYRRALS